MDILKDEDLSKEVFIRNMGQTVLAALHRQLAHFAYHVGQIVFTGKTIKKQRLELPFHPPWVVKKYNQEKFSKLKRTAHFSDKK